ncbi:MAG TPA: hypothetical protein VEH07_02930 [Alphaproteobacteria bacterium]|nr:hypothetical protein [Alphaproteobacteria bacterium]
MGVIGLDGTANGGKSLGALALGNAGGLSTLLFRIGAQIWVPLSIAANAFITLRFFNHLWPPAANQPNKIVDAIRDFGVFFTPYDKYSSVLLQFVQQHIGNIIGNGIELPTWSPDLAAIYLSTASALYFGSLTVAAREEFVEQAKSTAASAGWPIAIFGLLWQWVRGGFVTGFAQKHTFLFLGYIAASAAAAWVLTNFSSAIAHALSTVI